MAIIVSNKNRAAINSSFTPISGLCRESTIVINNDGTVQTSGILNLGNKGDKNVTILNIDTSALNWQNLVGENLKEAYQPILVFKNQGDATDIQSIEFEGNYFIVPDSITDKAVVYDIIYTLKEKLNDSSEDADDDDNDTEFEGNVGDDISVPHREVFVSAAFQGVVHPSFETEISGLNTPETDKSDTNLLISSNNYKALHKPLITINWIGETGLVSIQKNLGFKLDSLITPIEFKNFPTEEEEEGNFTVFFYRSDSLYKYVFNSTTSSLKMWVPKEVTEKDGEWKIGIKFENDSQTAVSNSLSFIVLQNFLTSEDLNEDSTQESSAALLSSEGEILNATSVDEDGNAIYSEIQTFEVSGSSYNLSYTGEQVNSLLGWINTNKDDVDSHIEDTNIHITAAERTLWNTVQNAASKTDLTSLENEIETNLNSLTDRVVVTENFIENFDDTVISTVTEHSTQITNLQNLTTEHTSNIQELENEDATIRGKINLINSDIDVIELNVKTNKDNIAALRDEINTFNTNIATQLTAEATARTEKDVLLEQSINNNKEITDQSIKTLEETLTEAINTEKSERESADFTQASQIDTVNTNIASINAEINSIKTDTTIIRNNSNVSGVTTFVAKIVFLNSEEDYTALEVKEAGTLYLIREEE